jgi:hypothetical protein
MPVYGPLKLSPQTALGAVPFHVEQLLSRDDTAANMK